MAPTPTIWVDDVESYWPLVRASLKTTIIAIAAQIGLAAFYGQLAAAKITVHFFGGLVPYLRISTRNPEQFETIVRWSAIASAAVIFTYAALAMLQGRRLQEQLGRSFGYLDIALIGIVNVASGHLLSNSLDPAGWMYSMIPIGLFTFATAAWFIRDDYLRRRADAGRPEVVVVSA